MVQDTIAVERVQRPLEGHGLVGPRARKQRNGRHHGLEIEVAGRRLEAMQ